MPNKNRQLTSIQLWRNQCGQDLIEYAMIAAFLVVSSTMVLPEFAQNVSVVVNKISTVWAARG
jgi:Flp pilus assembly pilin Flp